MLKKKKTCIYLGRKESLLAFLAKDRDSLRPALVSTGFLSILKGLKDLFNGYFLALLVLRIFVCLNDTIVGSL